MTFSVSPHSLQAAKAAGAAVNVQQAYEKLKALLNNELTTFQEKLRRGEITSSAYMLVPQESVERNPEYRAAALNRLAKELADAGFNAKYGEEPGDDDGPGRCTPGYDYIKITL